MENAESSTKNPARSSPLPPARRTLLRAAAAGAAGVALAAVPGARFLGSAPAAEAATYPGPGHVTGSTIVHDPEVTKSRGGNYLLAHTGDDRTGVTIALKTSSDRTHWTDAGQAFPGGAPWTHEYTGGGSSLWAPDLTFANNRYYLYYSASSFGSNHSGIFLATSDTGAQGSWVNRGLVVSSTTGDDYNAIDPNIVIDQEGRWWMSFGSFWSGLKMIRIDPGTGLRTGGDWIHLAGRGGDAIEAPTIHYRNGYYYLFASFDSCCNGADSTYRVVVGRSTNVVGPYVDRNGVRMVDGGGTEILAGHGSVHGPGHQAVLADNDADVFFYHYYEDDGTPRLGINLLAYDAGWPRLY